jgi:hypothetical protein
MDNTVILGMPMLLVPTHCMSSCNFVTHCLLRHPWLRQLAYKIRIVTPCTRGKAISCLSIVVVRTKTARSGDVGLRMGKLYITVIN